MNMPRLTRSDVAARKSGMDVAGHQQGLSGHRAWGAGALLVAGALMAAGCISVNAPDKPIVIELNINIKQEVVYRLAADAANTIDENESIF
jgi:hypothetical protein